MKGLALSACPSKILDKRWKLREKELHKDKLRNVKSIVRDQYGIPQGANLALRNGKKEAILERK